MSFNTVLRALATAGRAVEAQALYKRMLSSGVKETAASVAALMGAATASGHPETALAMWRSMQRGPLRPTSACAVARLDALLRLVRAPAALPTCTAVVAGLHVRRCALLQLRLRGVCHSHRLRGLQPARQDGHRTRSGCHVAGERRPVERHATSSGRSWWRRDRMWPRAHATCANVAMFS